jgi:hypothetical protein
VQLAYCGFAALSVVGFLWLDALSVVGCLRCGAWSFQLTAREEQPATKSKTSEPTDHRINPTEQPASESTAILNY